MVFYSKMERRQIVMGIVEKLRNFECGDKTIINLYDDGLCDFIQPLKLAFETYIKQNDDIPIDYKGTLFFTEINKNIEYLLPSIKPTPSLFVIRGKSMR
jgi:hypothetical protein